MNLPPMASVFNVPLVFNLCRVKLASFISETFRSVFIQNSDDRFYAVSVGSHSDLGDSVCVFDNVLRLSLTPESYSRLGLTGRKSSQIKGFLHCLETQCNLTDCSDRYIVDIKLNGESFNPGRRFFERVQKMFQKFHNEFLIWALCLKNGKPVQLDTSYEGFTDIQCQRVVFSSTLLNPVQVPRFHVRDSSNHQSFQPEYLQSLLDWFGSITLGMLGTTHHPVLTNIECCLDYHILDADPSAKYQVHRQEWKGMISSDQVNEAVSMGRKTVADNGVPWIALRVSGFKDAPLSFSPCGLEEENHFCDFSQLWRSDHAVLDDVSGENDYLLLILPKDQYYLFVNVGSGDNFTTM
eukprot:g6476.t1